MNLLIAAIVTFPTALITGVIVGGIQTLTDWLDDTSDERKRKKLERRKNERREELWNTYSFLLQD